VPNKSTNWLLSKSITENLIQWGGFSVLIAMTPMLFSYLWIQLSTLPPHPDFVRAVSSRGELLIVASALLGEALSDMLKRNRAKNLNLLIGGLCLAPLMVSCFLFAAIQTATQSQFPHQALDQEMILKFSHTLFVYSLCLGAACRLLGKV
jgi:hypothetical protein